MLLKRNVKELLTKESTIKKRNRISYLNKESISQNKKNQKDMKTIEIKTLENLERKYTNMIIEVYNILKKVEPKIEDEENLDLYIIEFEKEFKNYIKLKKYQNGVL